MENFDKVTCKHYGDKRVFYINCENLSTKEVNVLLDRVKEEFKKEKDLDFSRKYVWEIKHTICHSCGNSGLKQYYTQDSNYFLDDCNDCEYKQNLTIVHVIAANENEALDICRNNEILENKIKSVTKLESSLVLF